MCEVPEAGAAAPATGHFPCILFPTAFPIDFLRFEVQFSCSVWVMRIRHTFDSISAHVWYRLRINLCYSVIWCILLVCSTSVYLRLLPDFSVPFFKYKQGRCIYG